MDLYFKYTGLGKVEIMNGVFYDADLDPTLTNQKITEELSLTTTRLPSVSGSDFTMFVVGGSGFNSSRPITGITSNNTSKELQCGYLDYTSLYFTHLGVDPVDNSPVTLQEIEVEIRASDGELQSSPLIINFYPMNHLPEFDVKFTNNAGAAISSIDIGAEGDIFKVIVVKVDDVEDGKDYLRNVSPADMANYVKVILTDVTNPTRGDDLDIPGFSKTLIYDNEKQELIITYTCSNLATAHAMGSKVLSIALYDSMGIVEQGKEENMARHKNRTINGSFIINISANNLVVEPIATPTVNIAGVTYSQVTLEDDVDEGLSMLNIPFQVTADVATTFAIGLTVGKEYSGYIDENIGVQCIIQNPLSQGTYSGAITISKDSPIFTNYDSPNSLGLQGVIKIPVKNKWWGDFITTLWVGAGDDALAGIGSAQWRINVNAVNNAPELLV